MFYQYLGKEYTYARIREGESKIKIVPGEIIESQLDETYFTKNGFQKVEINIETKKTKKIEINIETKKTKKKGNKNAIEIEVS